jgi:hypothetical protein
VASGLIPRFSTLDCITDSLACFKNRFIGYCSIISFGEHRFYVVVPEPFPNEVANVSDPLFDKESYCSDSTDIGAMVEVMALGDEDGGDLPHTARWPLKRQPQREANAPPPPTQDMLDLAIQDLRAPLNLIVDPM